MCNGDRMRTLEAIVQRILVCRPVTDDPAECGLGCGGVVTDAFRVCKQFFWFGIENVRTDRDEATLSGIVDSVRMYLAAEGADNVALFDGFAVLEDGAGRPLKTIGYSDLRMPLPPDAHERHALDRTMKRGWRRRLWTTALLYRSLLWKRRGIENRLRDRKTALLVKALVSELPPDVLKMIVTHSRR